MVLSTQKILKGIYGLPQAGLIAKQLLQKYLAKNGYHQTKTTQRPWKYNTRPINISLVVDDFGIKYLKKTHADHLIKTLELDYTCDKNWDRNVYYELTIKWDNKKVIVDLSMPGYAQNVLHKFQHCCPAKPQHAPAKYKSHNYSTKVQYAKNPDT